ncbi:hypothetical protein PVK06_032754 [Gossypium arboreum]|uniref:Uncharacterized protein n=1 Tax=Gossypium arboreum TaxID=29729 RepID=A0ABR0NVU2_GOSAR|nr:hypothetical protein PVK06_032754 [Gossypium arboreum]
MQSTWQWDQWIATFAYLAFPKVMMLQQYHKKEPLLFFIYDKLRLLGFVVKELSDFEVGLNLLVLCFCSQKCFFEAREGMNVYHCCHSSINVCATVSFKKVLKK